MAEQNFNEIEVDWDFMTPMESAFWGTTLALHAADADGGLGAADEALTRLRRLCEARSGRPNLEDEAAESNVYMTYDEFVIWYAASHRIRYRRDPAYKPPTPGQIDEAYKRYSLSRESFY